MGPLLLSIKDLSVEFSLRGRRLNAIRALSLDLYENESLAIVGESGSGKSVLTKAFSGMLEANGRISGGSILFYDGETAVDLASLTRKKEWAAIRGRRIATVFQDPMTSLDPIMPIGKQIVTVIKKHRRVSDREARLAAIALMERVGIPKAAERFDHYPFEYSGGMRQRIVIAVALACRPKILICDEPTTALDVTIQAQILSLIKELQKELHFTTVFITHDLGVVANIADRVAVLYAGQIVELGLVEEIFYDPRHPYTWALLSSLPQLAEKGSEIYAIGGAPPSPFEEIQGDAFSLRSPYRLQIDRLKAPPFFRVSDTHFARTWLLDPRAPQVEKPEAIRSLHEKMCAAYRSERDS